VTDRRQTKGSLNASALWERRHKKVLWPNALVAMVSQKVLWTVDLSTAPPRLVACIVRTAESLVE